jgi:hypothetical protein
MVELKNSMEAKKKMKLDIEKEILEKRNLSQV